jgi:hypothetical protein
MLNFIDTGNMLKEVGVTTNINEMIKYTAATTTTLFNSGPFTVTLITGAANGTLIKSMTVKGFSNTVRGSIFLYLFNGGSPINIDSIQIDNEVQTGTQQAFSVTYELDYYLAAGVSIQAYMNTIQDFVITMDALDMSY